MFAKIVTALVVAVLGIGVVLAVSLLFAVPVWLVWNWVVPVVFGLAKITLLQALGLSILSGLLLKPSGVSVKS